MDSLKEKRMQKDRGVTPRLLLEGILENAEDINDIVVTVKYYNGSIESGYSYHNSLEALGILEVGKDMIKETMRTD